ncbi:MAG: helix-turn-helix transcriptional regulator, partial [Rhodobacteraceae bacterium]|nr:helix-turn-helix transcriptional regulator [Paracoccaceae bacterium]
MLDRFDVAEDPAAMGPAILAAGDPAGAAGEGGGGTAAAVRAIYAAAVEEGGLAGSLEEVRAAAGAAAAALWRAGRGGLGLLATAARCGDGAARDLALGLAAAVPPAGSEAPVGLPAGALLATVTAPGGGLRLVLARAAGAAPFAPATLARAADLAGHLAMAGAVASRIGAADVERRVFASLLDKLAVGAIFLDPRGQILRITGLGRDILAAQDGLRPFRGSVAATSDRDDRRLQAAIRAALGDPAGEPQVVPVARASGQRGLGLVIHRLAPGREAAEGRGAALVILVRDPEHAAEPECTMLRRLFDLTAAEAEVARQLAVGLSLDEVALALGIRRNTARAHLRAIFAKGGINRQSELIRLVLKSAAMLGEEP